MCRNEEMYKNVYILHLCRMPAFIPSLTIIYQKNGSKWSLQQSTYCTPSRGGIDDQDLNNLQVLQNRAVQLTSSSTSTRSSHNIIFDLVGWMTVRQLIFYHSAMSVLRVRNTMEPEELGSKLANAMDE